jgi:parallel beta-helix repeat protein
MVFTGNVLTGMAGTALAVTQPRVTVTGNVVVRNGYRGLVATQADGLVLSNNRFDRNNNAAGFDTTTCGDFCAVAGAKVTRTRTLTVTGNSFSGNDGAGFWCDLACIGATITHNTASGNTGDGLYYEVSATATITGNLLSGDRVGLKISGSSDVAVTANQFVDDGIDLGVYDDPRDPRTDPFAARNGLTWDTRNVAVSGNSFVEDLRHTTLLLDTNTTGRVSAARMISEFSHNTYQPATGGRVNWCAATCTTYASVSAFRSAVGFAS